MASLDVLLSRLTFNTSNGIVNYLSYCKIAAIDNFIASFDQIDEFKQRWLQVDPAVKREAMKAAIFALIDAENAPSEYDNQDFAALVAFLMKLIESTRDQCELMKGQQSNLTLEDAELKKIVEMANPKTKLEGPMMARMLAEVAKELPLFEEDYPMAPGPLQNNAADAALFAKMMEKRRIIRFVLKALAEDGLQRRRTLIRLLTYTTLNYRKDWEERRVRIDPNLKADRRKLFDDEDRKVMKDASKFRAALGNDRPFRRGPPSGGGGDFQRRFDGSSSSSSFSSGFQRGRPTSVGPRGGRGRGGNFRSRSQMDGRGRGRQSRAPMPKTSNPNLL